MDVLTFLEWATGIFFVVLGLSFLIQGKRIWFPLLQKLEDPKYLVIFGIMASTFGIILVLLHNTWERNFSFIVTVSGWGALAEGSIYLLFPGLIPKLIPRDEKFLSCIRWCGGALMLVAGALILWEVQ